MKKYLKFIIPCIVVLLSLFYKTPLNHIAFEIVCDILFFGGLFLLLIFDKDNKDLLLTLTLSPFMVYSYHERCDATFILGNILVLVGSIIHIKKYEVKKINIRNISFLIYLGFILIFTIYTTIRTFNTNDNFTNLFNFEQILMLIVCGILGYIIIATLRLDLDKDRFYFVNVFLTIILIDLIRNNQNFVPIVICFLPIFTLFIKNKNIIDKTIGYGLALIDVIFIVNNQCEEQDCSSFIIAMIIFTVCLALNHVKLYEIAIAVFVLSFVYFPLLFTDYKEYYSPEGVIQGPSYYLVKNYRALGISKELYMYSYGSGISYTLLSCSPLGLCALAFFAGIKYKMKKYNNIILLSWILLDIISFSYFNLYRVEYLFMTLMFILLKEDVDETKDIIPFNSNVISNEEMARD